MAIDITATREKLQEIIAWTFRLLGLIFITFIIARPLPPTSTRQINTSTTTTTNHNTHQHIWNMGTASCERPRDGKRTSEKKTAPLDPSPYCGACTRAASALHRTRSGADDKPSTDALPFLQCGGGCGSEHRAHLFSAEQRRHPDSERVCVGREGRVRLCSHVSFGWDEARRHSRRARNGHTVVGCAHASHRHATRGPDAPCAGKGAPRAEFWRSKAGSIVVKLSAETHIDLSDEVAAQQQFSEATRRTPATWWPATERWADKALFSPSRKGCVKPREEYWFGHGDCTQFLMRARRCGGERCATFEVERAVVIHRGPWDAQWRSALDPATFRQSEDVDMEGVSWCSDEACRSHEDEINGGRWGFRPEDFDRPLSRSVTGPKAHMRVRMRC